MKTPSELATSFLRKRAAEALQQARKLPVGPDRNDLRQLAVGLIWLQKKGLAAKALDRAQERTPFKSGGSEQRPALPSEN
jgi:hypothetical protein